MGGVLSLLGWALPHKAPPSGHKRPLATHMQGAVLALPSQDRSHTCHVRDRPPQLCIDRKAGRQSPQPTGVVTSSMSPLDSQWLIQVPPEPREMVAYYTAPKLCLEWGYLLFVGGTYGARRASVCCVDCLCISYRV